MSALTKQLELVLASGCGANAPGGGGFQKGNTCQKKGSGQTQKPLFDKSKGRVYAPFEKHKYDALNAYIEANTQRAMEEAEGTDNSASDLLVEEWRGMGEEGQYQWAKDQGIIPSGDTQADLDAPGMSQEDYEAVKPQLEEMVKTLDRTGYETHPSLEDFISNTSLYNEAEMDYLDDEDNYQAASEWAYDYVVSEMGLDPDDPLLDDKVDFDSVDANAKYYIQDQWGDLGEEGQYQYAKDVNVVKPFFKDVNVPDQYRMTSKGDQTSLNYDNTKSVAQGIQRVRGREIAAERGIEEKYLREAGSSVWSEWKSSSTSRWGGALQAAVSEEFGSFQTEGLGPYEAKALIGDEQYDALKAHVRATWESSQYIMDKVGVKDLMLYRALIVDMGDGEPVTKVTFNSNFGEKHFWKYEDINLRRNGAQSTTIDADVANQWMGAGATFNEGTQNRVVLRIKARPEAVVSLPVHGQNVYGEQEVVVSGSDWASWDAWDDEAPDKFWSAQE